MTCTKCEQEKPRAAFSRDARKSNGLQSRCKACAADDKRAWSKRNPDRRRAADKRYADRNPGRHLRTKFGVNPAFKWDVLEAQGGVCAGCGGDEHQNPRVSDRHGWCMDHDHDTGEIRGVLCFRCNMTLGWARDSMRRLSGLAVYLEGNAAVNTLLAGLGSSHESVGDGVSETASVAGIKHGGSESISEVGPSDTGREREHES